MEACRVQPSRGERSKWRWWSQADCSGQGGEPWGLGLVLSGVVLKNEATSVLGRRFRDGMSPLAAQAFPYPSFYIGFTHLFDGGRAPLHE